MQPTCLQSEEEGGRRSDDQSLGVVRSWGHSYGNQ